MGDLTLSANDSPVTPPEKRTEWEHGSRIGVGDVNLWKHDTGGEGQVVVLLGGFTAGHFVFDLIRQHLSSYRLITWEPRGLGQSDCPDPRFNEYSSRIWAADLRLLLENLGVSRAHLFADGFGGYIGLCFAAMYPSVVSSLVTSTEVYAGFQDRSPNWNVYRAVVDNFGTTGRGARMLAKWMDVESLPWFVDWEARNIEEVLHPETVAATVGYGLLEADVRSELASIKAPTLVMVDGAQPGDRESAAISTMRTLIENVQVEFVDGATSYGLVTHPSSYARAVLRFFDASAAGS